MQTRGGRRRLNPFPCVPWERFSTDTQAVGGDLTSFISGSLGSLSVARDIKDAFISVTGAASSNGSIGPVTIGGSLIGGAGGESGSYLCHREYIGAIKIGRDIIGGEGIGILAESSATAP